MDDMFTIVLEQADRLFQQHVTKQVLTAADAGEWSGELWNAITEAGLTLALVPEENGGSGLPAEVTARLIRRSAFHAVPLPFAETLMANRLWVEAGGEVADGPMTLAPVNPNDRLSLTIGSDGATLSGVAHHVAWGTRAGQALVLARDATGKAYLCRVDTRTMRPNRTRRNLAHEPRDDLQFDQMVLASRDVRPAPAMIGADGLMPFGAAIRVQQMVGGMERSFAYALTYANERVQFGRAIGKFQAIQHMLAIAAGHLAAASAAADALFETQALGDDGFAVALAKARVGEAAGQVAAACHQVHGAMGFTQDHPLHFASRRLWAWRDEWGAEAWWQEKIGRLICARGGEGFWPLIADRRAGEVV